MIVVGGNVLLLVVLAEIRMVLTFDVHRLVTLVDGAATVAI